MWRLMEKIMIKLDLIIWADRKTGIPKLEKERSSRPHEGVRKANFHNFGEATLFG